MEHRSDIEQLVQSTPEAIPREIHDLIIEIVKIRNENVIKFTSHDTSIYMKPSTVCFMLDLEHCVKNALCSIYYVYSWCRLVGTDYAFLILTGCSSHYRFAARFNITLLNG